MRKSLVLLAGALLLLTAFVMLWLQREPGERAAESQATPPASPSTTLEEAPALRGDSRSPAAAPPEVPLVSVPEAAPPQAKTGPVVRGTVQLPGGKPAVGALVYVRELVDGTAYIARTKTDGEGRFVFTPSLSARPRTVAVGALLDGYKRTVEEVGLPGRGERQVDLVLERGRSLHGRVVDEQGDAVAGLVVFVTSNPSVTTGGRTEKYFQSDQLRLAAPGSNYHEAYARTDDRGMFVVHGLGEATYIVRSVDPAWFVRQDYGRLATTAETIGKPPPPPTLTALRAMSLELLVHGADSLHAIPEFFAELQIVMGGQVAYSMPLDGEAGRVAVVWRSLRSGAEFDNGFLARVRVRAPHHEEQVREVAFGPEDGFEQVLEVGLARLTTRTVDLRVVDAGGHPYGGNLAVSLIRGEHGRRPRYAEQPHTSLPPVEGDPGRYRLPAAPGLWWASIRPDTGLGSLLRWRGAITVAEEPRGEQRVVLPPFGSLRFRVLDAGPQFAYPARVLLRRQDPGVSSAVPLTQPDVTFAAFPPGQWSLELRVPGFVWHGNVEVVAGRASEVEVVPRAVPRDD